jgi:hypothetical protein
MTTVTQKSLKQYLKRVYGVEVFAAVQNITTCYTADQPPLVPDPNPSRFVKYNKCHINLDMKSAPSSTASGSGVPSGPSRARSMCRR